MKEHQQRFQNNGSILEVAEEWAADAVVDIQSNKMGPPDQYGKEDIYALCDENFESIRLISDGTEQVVKLFSEESIENLLGIDIFV